MLLRISFKKVESYPDSRCVMAPIAKEMCYRYSHIAFSYINATTSS